MPFWRLGQSPALRRLVHYVSFLASALSSKSRAKQRSKDRDVGRVSSQQAVVSGETIGGGRGGKG